ncbi:enoyl-ACP reductase FabI [Thiocystis violascens]|uniref:Enoyl-[acyl-carrier-protein] reductase [NADH] n=1 Tax=Thiocystis violascens (strain ATCC 17096 / DSM 198 / 6111) TaxID=765911 RepID=I3Y7P5_THIV6|nr:enoyl-ACP reductase FabI [Thiocystis violascens]AFL73013.1 enoyl-(acyl-carrier-protein) reductase (NADH) [Thiocystis violascens DSM 198]
MLDASYFSLEGKKGLVIGIANEQSIAYGCARAFRTLGAELAITYLNEKARAFVEPAAQAVDAKLFLPCDVMAPGELEAVFEAVREQWGRLDFVVHSIAFAPREDLQGRLVDSSADGFGLAVNVSAHSFLRMARLAEPLMTEGGSLFAMTFHGSEKVLPTYNLMGPVKAALESAVRYTAAELGSKNIRAFAISPGPLHTRAASGLKDFDVLVDMARERSPLGRLAEIDDVGAVAAMLATRTGAMLTGQTIYVDGGFHITG